jgi:uncharacterized protein YjbJ (UPF0337 family)
MQSNQQNHSKLLTVILAGVASIGFAAAASAAGGTLGTNTHVGAGAQTAPASGTSIGGAADARMNASGNTNSNAQWKDTASQGLGRAQDRVGTAQDRVSTQAEVMRTQAQSQAEEQKAQAQSQAEQMKLQGQSMKPTPQGQLGVMSSKTAKKKH